MPFEPGKSGNPSGRPKVDRAVVEACRALSLDAVNRLAEWMASDNAKASVSACNALLDRAYGKPTQPISGDDEADPIRVAPDFSRLSTDELTTMRALMVKAATK